LVTSIIPTHGRHARHQRLPGPPGFPLCLKFVFYVLYLFIAGIVVYWITSSYGVLNGVLYGYFGLGGFSCFFTGCHSETGWNLFTQSALFTVDLKILFYLAIIFLSIKNKNREWIAKS